MSQQNIWKKQMMANKAQNNTVETNSSPISQFPKQQKITPPWMKKNDQQANNTAVSSNQPAWMKNKQPATTSQPAWMKNNTQSAQVQNNSTTPAWMQNKNNQQPSNVPAWKAGGTAFGADKKKKQEEERLKKQQQERERLQRQQQQKKQAQKQRQRQNEEKQRKQMERQDVQSKQRQSYDLIKQKQQKRLQEQQKERKRLEEQEINNKKSHQNQNQKPKLTSSSKKHLSTNVKQPPSSQAPVYIKFLHYFSQSINPSNDYKQKIANQKQLLKISKQFSQQMQQQIVQLVRRKILGDTKVLSQDKKNKIVNMEQLNTQLYYALCEGQQKQIQTDDHSTNLPEIKFDMSSIQKFQKVFTFYNILTDIFCTLSKKQPSSMISKFRVPLFSLLQYKGISFLCEAYTMDVLSTQCVLPSVYKEITNDFSMIEKELKQKYNWQLDTNDLMVKKVNLREIQQEVYIFYLKNWNVKMPSSLKEKNKVTIQQLTTDYHFLSNQDNKRKVSSIPDIEFQTFRKVKTQSFSDLADIAQLAQCIFVVYSSCQGEVEQKQFWELILSESDEIWTLIRSAGYKGKLHKNKRFLFQVFEAFSGVKIKFESKKSSKNQKLSIKETKCLISNYKFSKFEINEIIGNFDKYLKQNKLELALRSLNMMREIEELGQQQNVQDGQVSNQNQKENSFKETSNNKSSITYAIKLCKYLVAEQKILKAVKMLQKYLSDTERFKNNAYSNIPIKMQILLLYIKMKKEDKILKTFKELLQVVQFYYGSEGLINATLYQMLASYYSLVAKKSNNASSLQMHIITLYEHATSILIKYYGDQSQLIAELYLSRAVSFLNLKNYQLFNRDIQHSLRIFKSHSKQKQKIAQCLFYKGKQKLQNEAVINKTEGISFIEQSAGIFMKICHYSEAIDAYLLVIQMLDKKMEQNVKRIQALSNLVIDTLINSFKSIKHLVKGLKIIIQKLDPQVLNIIEQQSFEKQSQKNGNLQQHQENNNLQKDQMFLELQNLRKGFQNFTEIIKWLSWNSVSYYKNGNYENPSKQKFNDIVKVLGNFISIKQQSKQQQEQMEDQEQESQDQIQKSERSQIPSDLQQQQTHQNEFDSPIKRMNKKSSVASSFSQSQNIENIEQ